MDPLTHTLMGAALSRAGFNRWSPRAGVLLILAANAPDIDVVCAAGGSLNYLDFHRHLTHTFLAAPVLAAVIVGAVAAFRPSRIDWRRNWARMFLAAMAGVLSHLLLDWTNIYGIRWFLPFSGVWHQAGIANVVDVWIWLILAIAVVVPFFSRLISTEIGAKKGSGAVAAVFALVLLCGYEFARYLLHNRASETLQSRLYRGEVPLRVFAIPGPVNPFVWTGLVETSGSYSVHTFDLMQPFDPGGGRVLYKPDPQPALDIARRTATVRQFLAFSQAPYWRVTPVEDPQAGSRVEVMDLRFGRPPEARFVAIVIVAADGRVLREEFSFGIKEIH